MHTEKRMLNRFAALALGCGLTLTAQAQIGSGWTPSDETFKVQESGSGVVSGDNFSITKDSSGTKDRAEREYKQYTSGTHQFQGDFTVQSFGGTDICIKQTFHVDGGPWVMLAVNRGNTFSVGGSFTIGTSVRINTITDMSKHTCEVYINGQLKKTYTGGQSPIYDKCGTYRMNAGEAPIKATWHNVHLWEGGKSTGGGSTVATPTFSPGGGTYSTAQNVSIMTTTGGASIRYTADGSTPTSTTGTSYSGPVAVASTTTLKAIAYASGSNDSSVASATYTITPTGGSLSWEAESLARTTSGTAATTDTDASASGGARVTLNSTNTGSWLQFTLPNVPAGTYSLQLAYKTNANRGRATFKVDGTTVGGTLDQYTSSSSYPTATIGTVTFASAGDHTFRLTVASKNSSSSDYTLSADKIILVGQ